jgi:hypothetical protein
MLTRILLILAFALGLSLTGGTPALSQAGGSALIIYGNDRCPPNTVCVRAPESERFRIPQSLRTGPVSPQDQPWSARAKSVANAGAATGTGSCTATGAGGFTGCWRQQMEAGRAENNQAGDVRAQSPEPR